MVFNLLVTTARGLEDEARKELLELLKAMSDEPQIERTPVSGLLKVTTTLPVNAVISEVGRIASEEPWMIRYVLRMIPIEKVVTSLKELSDTAKLLSSRIADNETFRVTVEKRHANLSSKDLVNLVASVVEKKVDLENPDWIVQVEVIKSQIGVSVLRAGQILSTVKIKRAD
jgi:tRNA acetyltransferase TAN1